MQVVDQYKSAIADYARAKLDNGLDVVVCSRPKTRSYGCCLAVPTGGRDGKPHLAHLVEHLAMRDNSEFRLQSEYVNAFTRFASTDFQMFGHIDSMPGAFKLLQQVFQPLDVDDARVRSECEVLLRERFEVGGTQMLLNQAHYRVLGGDSIAKAYRTTKKNKPLKLNARDCIEFHSNRYDVSNSILTFVSPYSTDDMLAKLHQQLGHFSAPEKVASKVTTSLPRRRLNTTWHAGNYVTYALWHNMPKPNFDDRFTIALANEILGRFGRLFDSIRDQNQLSYGVYVTPFSDRERTGQLVVFNMATSKLRKAVKLVADEIRKICLPLPSDEFAEYVNSYVESFEMTEESVYTLPTQLMNWCKLQPDSLLTPEQVTERIRQITPETLAAALNDFFAVENRHFYLGGSFGPLGWRAARKFALGRS